MSTMKIPKPSDVDRDRFSSLVPDGTGVETKRMFGNVGAFVNGNMFMGLFGSDIGIELPDDARAELLAEPGSGPFGPAGRPMSGDATIPAEWTAEAAAPWIEQALAAAAALAPKSKKRPPSEAPAKRATKARQRST